MSLPQQRGFGPGKDAELIGKGSAEGFGASILGCSGEGIVPPPLVVRILALSVPRLGTGLYPSTSGASTVLGTVFRVQVYCRKSVRRSTANMRRS